MENWLASGDKIDAVASNNGRDGARRAHGHQGRGQAGQDLRRRDRRQPGPLDSMDKGELNMTVFQIRRPGRGRIEGAYLVAKSTSPTRGPRATSSGSRTRKSPRRTTVVHEK